MKNPAIRYGVLGALLVFAYYLALYLVDKALYINLFWIWLPIVLYVFFMWKAAVEQRSLQDNRIDFKGGLRAAFIVYLLTNLGYYFFSYGIHLYDAELMAMEAQQQIAYFQSQIDQGLGDPQEANRIRQEIEHLQANGLTMDLGYLLLLMARGTMFGFLIAAGIGYFVKTE